MKKKIIYLFLIGIIASCTTEDSNSVIEIEQKVEAIHERFNKAPIEGYSLQISNKNLTSFEKSSSSMEFMEEINQELSNQGLPIQLSMMEYYTNDGMGNTVFFNDRGNKQLGGDFVPADPRRGGFTDIAYAIDGTEGATASGLSQGQTDGAILSAMNTWSNVACSDGLTLTSLGSSPFDLGYVEALVTGGAQGAFFFTDLMHSGFNTTVTDAVFGPGSSVLGVTFTFNFIDPATGNPTDIDSNGKADVAFRDIYYNDRYLWGIGTGVDVETVVLHEAGHGLSQGHFGKLFRSNGNDEFHFAPRALMNAGYTGIQRSVEKTDKAGHCSNWAQWPNN